MMRAVSGLTRRPGSEPETVVGMVSRFCNCSEVVLVEMLGRRRVRRAQRSMMTRRTSTTATTPSCRPNPVDVQADVSLTGTLSAMEPYPLVSKVVEQDQDIIPLIGMSRPPPEEGVDEGEDRQSEHQRSGLERDDRMAHHHPVPNGVGSPDEGSHPHRRRSAARTVLAIRRAIVIGPTPRAPA